MQITIRKLLPEDVDGICEIEKSCFKSEAWPRSDFEELAEDSGGIFAALTAVADGKVLGYICGNCVASELEIGSLAVAPQFRRLGVATALIAALEDVFRPEKAFLEVRESNLPARKLYESIGFYKIYIRKNYYSSPQEDAVIMEKKYGSV